MSGFVLGTKYDTDKSNLDKKISDADRKYLTLVDFLKQQIVILKLLRQKAKYLVLMVQLLLLH